MAIFGNFKGTTQSEFKIGKNSGNRIITGSAPSTEGATAGDLYIDSANVGILQYEGNSWLNISEQFTDLNVDNGTLYVDSSNDTVSIGSTSSNEKLFVNGSLRLGTNPAINYSGAFLDVKHSNGTGTVVRVRDNNTGTDPVFKIYNANNVSEVFRVDGANVTINNSYTLPTLDGIANQVLQTDGAGNISFADLSDPVEDYGVITEESTTVLDYGGIQEDARKLVAHDSYTVAELESLTTATAGDMAFVSNDVGGSTMAFYDGTNWRRVQDRNTISVT
jgi:hypothetical protein